MVVAVSVHRRRSKLQVVARGRRSFVTEHRPFRSMRGEVGGKEGREGSLHNQIENSPLDIPQSPNIFLNLRYPFSLTLRYSWSC